MGKIIAIDYGAKRCGLAETDDLQMIASGLTTVENRQLIPFLKDFCQKNTVSEFVIGLPARLSGANSAIEVEIAQFLKVLQKEFPAIPVARQDEYYSSKEAVAAMVAGGMKKNQRRQKENIDRVSATIILQRYLEERRKSGNVK